MSRALHGAPAPGAGFRELPNVGVRLPHAAPDAMRLLLVRHGATTWNAAERIQGRADVPLSDEGRAQAATLARTLRDLWIDAAYTSPLRRARATADAILAGRNLRAVAVPALAEMYYGERQGQRRAEWLADAPSLVAQWDTAPWTVRFPGGESLADVQRRVVPVWQRLVAAHRGETVLLTGHGHVNRVLILHAAGLPPEQFWEVPQPNGACVLLDVSEGLASATLLST